MEQRAVERMGRSFSVVGLGTWQLGADWGTVDAHAARSVLETAVEHGVTFFDTADVYGDGLSERFCAELRAPHPDVVIATKMGRRVEQLTENYSRESLLAWNDRSRANLGVEQIDLVQLHCPPDGVYASDEVFDVLDEMVAEGRVRAYGVSVETCAQALAAIARPRVATVQIILNCFRLKPLEQVLPAAREAGVVIIARVPLASGLLSGNYDEHTTFVPDDHRSYNRHGESFTPALLLSHHLAGRLLTLTVTLPKGASAAITAILRAYNGNHRFALHERRITARHRIATVRFKLTSRELHATKISLEASAAHATSKAITLTHPLASQPRSAVLRPARASPTSEMPAVTDPGWCLGRAGPACSLLSVGVPSKG